MNLPSPAVLMMDHEDRRLHRCGDVNMTTACGLRLDSLTVGPAKHVAAWSESLCAECWEGYDPPG